jgi:hypothetical protein
MTLEPLLRQQRAAGKPREGCGCLLQQGVAGLLVPIP